MLLAWTDPLPPRRHFSVCGGKEVGECLYTVHPSCLNDPKLLQPHPKITREGFNDEGREGCWATEFLLFLNYIPLFGRRFQTPLSFPLLFFFSSHHFYTAVSLLSSSFFPDTLHAHISLVATFTFYSLRGTFLFFLLFPLFYCNSIHFFL